MFDTQSIIANFLHVGGRKSSSSPKTKAFWDKSQDGIIYLKPEMQKEALIASRDLVQSVKAKGGDILVVCIKSGLHEEVVRMSDEYGFHYLIQKVPAGFLTNFDTLVTTISSMNEKRAFIETDNYASLTKKEQASIKRQLAKTEKVYAGVKALTKKPDLVIVVDASQLGGLVAEIPHSGVQNIMLCSTDFAHRWADGQVVVMNMNNQKAPLYVLDKLFA